MGASNEAVQACRLLKSTPNRLQTPVNELLSFASPQHLQAMTHCVKDDKSA